MPLPPLYPLSKALSIGLKEITGGRMPADLRLRYGTSPFAPIIQVKGLLV